MAGNLDCLGVPERRIEEFVLGALEASRRAGAPGRHPFWRDPSGAALALCIDGDDFACMTPFFDAREPAEPWLVRTSGLVPDPECADCGGCDCDALGASGKTLTRCTLQWLVFGPWRELLREPRALRVRVVAFAQDLEVHADEAAFNEGAGRPFGHTDAGTRVGLAPGAFLPVGMFGRTEGVEIVLRATARFGGRVLRSERLRNEATGVTFRHLLVQALPGQVDVVAPDVPGIDPTPGAIAWVRAWMVCRPVDPPPATRPAMQERG